MSEVKQVNIALTQLRQAAQKAAQEQIKGVTQKIVEAQRAKRLEQAKSNETLKKLEETLETLNEQAAQIVADFEAGWGTWDNKPTEVSN